MRNRPLGRIVRDRVRISEEWGSVSSEAVSSCPGAGGYPAHMGYEPTRLRRQSSKLQNRVRFSDTSRLESHGCRPVVQPSTSGIARGASPSSAEVCGGSSIWQSVALPTRRPRVRSPFTARTTDPPRSGYRTGSAAVAHRPGDEGRGSNPFPYHTPPGLTSPVCRSCRSSSTGRAAAL